MWQLWQWHEMTAQGEQQIIERVRELVQWKIEVYQDFIRHPPVINTIEDAKNYVESNEIGVINESE